jgi:hypothetical protein
MGLLCCNHRPRDVAAAQRVGEVRDMPTPPFRKRQPGKTRTASHNPNLTITNRGHADQCEGSQSAAPLARHNLV